MRQLLLLRHAKSPSDDPSLSDHARPLNAAGRRTAQLMRGALGGLGVAPELVLVSSARRTRQTLEALEPWAAAPAPPRVRVLDSLYLASGDQVLAVLRQVGDLAERVMVLGHNPGLHELALALVGAPDGDGAIGQGVIGQGVIGQGVIGLGAIGADQLSRRFPTGALAEFAVAAEWAALQPGAGVRLVRFLCPSDLPEMAS